jgi:hypothetical protein
MVIPSLIMLINSLLSPPSCDLKLINGKSLNKSKTKEPTNKQWIMSEKDYGSAVSSIRAQGGG